MRWKPAYSILPLLTYINMSHYSFRTDGSLAVYAFDDLILINTNLSPEKSVFSAYFTDEEIKTLRDRTTCPRLPSWQPRADFQVSGLSFGLQTILGKTYFPG